eukprot:TRINITY_DN10607_c0_g1_i12.p1 TRINITY_DN10607_c0_g1~~TRINITY_DN10607_c0_g1_i12.p1  ORF type:complete len:132 (-),score=16.28 TRINITY_DN10607_c0_g1_i12:11-406(-)
MREDINKLQCQSCATKDPTRRKSSATTSTVPSPTPTPSTTIGPKSSTTTPSPARLGVASGAPTRLTTGSQSQTTPPKFQPTTKPTSTSGGIPTGGSTSTSGFSAPVGRGVGQIGRAVQQECRDRSRMPSSA